MGNTVDLYREELKDYQVDRLNNNSNVFSFQKIMLIKHRHIYRSSICKYCYDEPDGLAFPPKSRGVYRCRCPLGEKSKYERYPILGPVEMKEWE